MNLSAERQDLLLPLVLMRNTVSPYLRSRSYTPETDRVTMALPSLFESGGVVLPLFLLFLYLIAKSIPDRA